MINYLLLLCVVLGVSAQSVIQKQFNENFADVGKSNYLYNFVMTAVAFLCFFIAFLFSPSVNLPSLPYSLAFGVTFCTAIVFQFLAIKTGPLSLTALVVSFSLLIPTFYGIIFCGEKLSLSGIFGLVSFAASLLLVNARQKEERKITKKYLLFLLLAFLGNGFCSTVQKMHQTEFCGEFGEFFMFFALGLVVLFNLFMLMTHKPENKKSLYKKGVALAACTGFFNGAVNFLMVFLATRLPSAILYPTASAGSMVIVFFVALIFYKERLKIRQYFGYALGAVAVVLLNI